MRKNKINKGYTVQSCRPVCERVPPHDCHGFCGLSKNIDSQLLNPSGCNHQHNP